MGTRSHDRVRGLVVGGGIVGAHCALAMALRGWEVTLCERDTTIDGPSVRSLGLIRLSGRADGEELKDAVYGRHRWLSLARRIPGLGVTPTGSITLLSTPAEMTVAKRYVRRFADRIELDILGPHALRGFAPEITGRVLGALWCKDDMTIKPATTVPRLLEYLEVAEGVSVHRATPVSRVERFDDHLIATTPSGVVSADVVFICTGHGDGPEIEGGWRTWAELETVHLEAAEVDLGVVPTLPTTDGSAFSLYAGFRDFLDDRSFRPDHEWIVAPDPSGTAMIGAVRHRPNAPPLTTIEQLIARTARIYGVAHPVVRRRWTSPITIHRGPTPQLIANPIPGVYVTSAFGQAGNTLAPSVALTIVETASEALSWRRGGRVTPPR